MVDKNLTDEVEADAAHYFESIQKLCCGFDCKLCYQHSNKECIISSIRDKCKDEGGEKDFESQEELNNFLSWLISTSEVYSADYCISVTCSTCSWNKGYIGKDPWTCRRTRIADLLKLPRKSGSPIGEEHYAR